MEPVYHISTAGGPNQLFANRLLIQPLLVTGRLFVTYNDICLF